jgi:hypothetical protein
MFIIEGLTDSRAEKNDIILLDVPFVSQGTYIYLWAKLFGINSPGHPANLIGVVANPIERRIEKRGFGSNDVSVVKKPLDQTDSYSTKPLVREDVDPHHRQDERSGRGNSERSCLLICRMHVDQIRLKTIYGTLQE